MDATRLWHEHHAPLVRYLVRLTGDADLADDAAQEAFTRLVATPPRAGNTRAWLYTVATNVVRAWANRRRRHVRLMDGAGARAIGDPPRDPGDALEAARLQGAVRIALDGLAERDRTILLMRAEGFAHREIAEAVGTTTGSVGTLVARALDRLAHQLPLDAEDTRP